MWGGCPPPTEAVASPPTPSQPKGPYRHGNHTACPQHPPPSPGGALCSEGALPTLDSLPTAETSMTPSRAAPHRGEA